nr:histone deacetylase 14 [Tanacetum cinerariifolium]
MADVNINAPAGQAPTMAPPVRADDQILPRIRWVPIGKSNGYLDLDKSQSNLIYKIASAGCYRCQLDEQWFDLTKDTLKDALQITPVNNNQSFTSPPSSDALINFVNELGYPKKHKFHPRPDSPLLLPNEEPVLGYLKFSAKGTKREVFGMPILSSLITADIQEASYYQEYLVKVANHQRYLAGETGSDPDSPASKPKSTMPKAPPRPSVSKPVTSAQPEPKPTPAKTQGKKRKPTTEMSDKPSKATKSRHGFDLNVHSLGLGPYTMADVNGNAPAGQAPTMAPPVRTDDQILPRIRWVPIGKRNGYLDLDKSQSNPIYKIAITPVNNNQSFTFPPSSDALINFVTELGYPKRLDLKGQGLPCYRFFGVSSLKPILYAERIWEESPNPSILSLMTKGIWKHKFHPRPDSPLLLPNEEPVLRYLKFSAKGTKREVFGMPILGSLITADIQEASYYQEYLPISTLKSVDESAEDVPAKEPQVDAEEADMQRALEERLKSMYDVPWGPLPPVVIREPESGKYQPLPEVPGKGKANVIEDQVAQDQLNLQKPKRKSHADQYIFQRHTSAPTGSSKHDESSSLYAEFGLLDSEEESQEVVPGADAGGQGQAGSNPDEQPEGQAGPDPCIAETSQPILIPVVHAGSDREHMDLNVADVSPQPPHEQMDKGFTATAYPKVQENLKLTVEEHVLLEEPASSSETLSSLQHLKKDLSFGDLFFSDKPSKANHDEATAETEAESMVSVMIQQDMSSIPPMTSPIIKLTSSPESPKVHQLKAIATETTTTTTTTLPPLPYQQQIIAEAKMMKRIEADMKEILHQRMWVIDSYKSHEDHMQLYEALEKDLPEADMKEILHQRMWEIDSYKSHEDHMQLYEALEKSMNHDHSEELAKDLAEARKKKKKSRKSPKMPPRSPPPPLLPAGPSGASRSSGAFGSSQVPPSPPPPPSTNQEDLQIDEDMAPDEQAQSSDDEDIGSAHILKVNLRQVWWKPLEDELPATPEPAWSISSSDVPVSMNIWASALASNYLPPLEDSLLTQTGDIATFMDYVDDSILRHNVSEPLPLGGPPGQVKIQSDFFFNKDLEYLRYGSKGSRPTLSISKMKAYYPDVGLEQMVPD